MASTRISAPMRGVAYQLSRLSIRRGPLPTRILQSSCAAHTRSITTSTSSLASVSPITTSAIDHVPVQPFSEQTVLATIHQFPSLEPLRFETYPANHLYLPTRKDILHRAVIYEGDMTRLGTASTKTRYEVRGSARKIRPQKGSGRARLGDKKSPMLRGGGVAFGPKPRDFATGLQKKVYDLAWRTALSYRFRKGELIIVDNAMELESPSTRLLNDIFKHHEKLRGKGRSLLVTLEERPLLEEALAEMDRAEQTLTWQEVDVKNLLELSRVIIERDALQNILLAHQEDLTHVSLQPWDKSFIRKSPPKLEEEIGWAEFRDLQLLSPKEQKEARPAAFESVASQRYAYAETLPEGPKRDDLMRSAYELIAESKQLQLEEVTGTSFAEYVQEREQNPDYLPPKVQILGVQESRLIEQSGEAGQTSQLESDELDLKASRLHIQIHEIRQQAALLAAQAFEHLDVAQRLQGKTEEAQRSLELAGAERTYVDQLATDIDATKSGILDLRIRITQQKMAIAKAEGNTMYRGNLQKKWEALVAERDAIAQAQAEALAQTEALDDEQALDEESLQEEIDDPKDPRYVPLSPPIREEMRRMQRAQRLKEEAAAAKAAAAKAAERSA